MYIQGNEKSQYQARYYQITIDGKVDPSWSEWFSGLKLAEDVNKHGYPITRLTGTLPDQVALRGVLNKLWDLNITLLSVITKKYSSRRKK